MAYVSEDCGDRLSLLPWSRSAWDAAAGAEGLTAQAAQRPVLSTSVIGIGGM